VRRVSGDIVNVGGKRTAESAIFRQTSRLRNQATFPLLVDTVKTYFKDQTPNLGWLAWVLLFYPVNDYQNFQNFKQLVNDNVK